MEEYLSIARDVKARSVFFFKAARTGQKIVIVRTILRVLSNVKVCNLQLAINV